MLLLLAACRVDPPPEVADLEPPTGDTAPQAVPCPTFAPGEAIGAVESDLLVEASGLVVHDGVLWTHNDSGAPALLAMDPDGSTRSWIPLEGVSVVDWEDLTLLDGKLLIGDIGDNLSARISLGLVEVPLPDPDADGVPVAARHVPAAWETGPRDAEALLADPVTGDLLAVSKVFDGLSVVARAPTPLADPAVLQEVLSLQFGAPPLGHATLVAGGAIAPDGSGVVLRTYLDAFVWPRVPGEPWADTFARAPCFVDLETEPQGEAIAWAADGLYTVSEGVFPTIWRYSPSIVE